MDTTADRLGRLGIILVGGGLGAVLGWFAFVFGPAGNLARLLGIGLVVVAAVVAARLAGNLADRVFAPYNVAEVSVTGPIQREGGGTLPSRPDTTPADAYVDQIEAADADENAQALIVHLNTPGGEVVPSDDIRRAAVEFDGPTAAYATDTCASGGYWIASGCDTIVAREGSIVGSIGVIASRVTAADLVNTLGLTYERLVAGEYKDAGVPLRDMQESEREYLQGLVDDYYEDFIERVSEGREIDESTIRDTEAKVYLGTEAAELGLVDRLGTHEDVEAWLEDELETEVAVREFQPPTGLRTRLRRGGASVAFSFGAGLASVLSKGVETDASVPKLRS